MRGLANVIALVLITGMLVPAVPAAAARPHDAPRPQHAPSSQGFGVQLADVPAAEVANPRALRYIIDYLPTGTVIHRRILIINDETRHRALHRVPRRRPDQPRDVRRRCGRRPAAS